MKRVVTPELLDSEGWTQSQLGAALDDLSLINRWFGGISTMTDMLLRVSSRTGLRELSMLDVGGADGDLAKQARKRLARNGIRLSVTVADRAASHLNHTGVASDATALPFRNGSFDVVGCSLLVHHLHPEQVKAFAAEALRVCRVAMLINDLRRSAVHLAFVYSGFPLYRSPLTRNDGPASVRAAYTPEELRELLRGLSTRIEIRNHYFYRMAAIIWKMP